MNTCKNCNHWEPQAPIVSAKNNMGECGKLSQKETPIKKEYLLPVIEGKKLNQAEAEIITAANFGCNQFAEA